MHIIAGHYFVEAEKRDAYVWALRHLVYHARKRRGCVDFAISADVLDPMRINNYELWESEDDHAAFRAVASPPEFDVEVLAVHMSTFEVDPTSGTFDQRSSGGGGRRD